MKILVTGGAGFIASHIADALIEQGHHVVIVDNMSAGKPSNINKKARFYQEDIRSRAISEIFAEEKFDAVDHHAAQIDVRKSVNDPGRDADINILGSLNLLENCVKHGVHKFVFASSGGTVYGENPRLPATEDDATVPLSPYGISKLTMEKYLYYYHSTYGINYSILRYGNVYGPRQDPHGEAGVIAIFILKILGGQAPVIFGDGSQLRDYVYVQDVVKANLLSLDLPLNTYCNVGTGVGTSVNELFSIIRELTGFGHGAEYTEARKGELMRNYLDYGRLNRLRGWKPEVNIKEGIAGTVEYFRNRNNK